MEVLKGPQALYFGKNSPAGVVSYTTADPTEEFELQLGLGYETESEDRYYQGIVSGPVTDTLSGRLAVRFIDDNGWLNNPAVADPAVQAGLPPGFFSTGAASSDTYSGEETFIRGTLLWEPTDSVRMRTKYTYNKNELHYSSFGSAQRILCPTGVGRSSAVDCTVDFNAPVHRSPPEHRQVLPPMNNADNDFTDMEMSVITNELNWHVTDNWNVTAITGYFDSEDIFAGTIDVGELFIFRSATQELNQEHISQEIRLESDFDGPVNFTVGGLWGDSEQTVEIIVAFTNIPVPVLGPVPQPKTTDTRTLSAFGQVDWEITDQLSLTAGARWTEEDKDFTASEGGVPITNLVRNSATFDDVSPEVTLSWRPTDNAMLYVGYKEGFKSGGFNGLLVPGGFNFQAMINPGFLYDVSYEPETAEGFEIGAKTEWLDNRLRINAVYYDYEYTNLQLGRFNPETNSLVVVNASELNTSGVEVDALYVAKNIEGLTLRGAISYLDTEFGNYRNAPCWEGQTIAQGCSFDFDPLLMRFVSQDLTGARSAYSPEWSHSWGFTYERPATAGWNWSLSVDAIYTDEHFLEQAQTPGIMQDSHWLYNAAISLADEDDTWNLTLAGRNLGDEVVLTGAYTATGTGSGTGTTVGAPADMNGRVARGRQIWLELRYRLR